MQSIDAGWTENHTLRAQELSGAHIGDVIQFRYQIGSGNVHVVAFGELRQISHNSAETVINVSDIYSDTGGEMTEFVIAPGDWGITLEDL